MSNESKKRTDSKQGDNKHSEENAGIKVNENSVSESESQSCTGNPEGAGETVNSSCDGKSQEETSGINQSGEKTPNLLQKIGLYLAKKWVDELKADNKNKEEEIQTLKNENSELSKKLSDTEEDLKSKQEEIGKDEKEIEPQNDTIKNVEEKPKKVDNNIIDNKKESAPEIPEKLNFHFDKLIGKAENFKKVLDLVSKGVNELQDFAKRIDSEKANEATNSANKLKETEDKLDKIEGELKEKNSEIEQKLKEFKASNESLKKEHEEELTKSEKIHKAFICDINKKHDSEKSEMIEANKKSISVVEENCKKKEDELNVKIGNQAELIATLYKEMDDEYTALRNQSESVASKLFEFLKTNDIMGACSEDYNAKVEEKIQDIIVGAKTMKCKICNISTSKKSDWIFELNKIITEQLDNNSSFICQFLKYYAMSNVPFMIDESRNYGIYFMRKNISQAYDTFAMLLSLCGITPIIPAIFVENINEGEYEVEGVFNDIESFCPGSINDHIKHIERNGNGLDGVIIGVTKVGYKCSDGKIVKALVLTK